MSGEKEFLGVMIDKQLVRKFKSKCNLKGEPTYSGVVERLIYNLVEQDKKKVWTEDEPEQPRD